MTLPRPAPILVDGKVVRSLVEARALRGAVVVGRPGGWAVVVRYGAEERAIGAQRSRKMRLWRNVDTAIRFVKDELGVPWTRAELFRFGASGLLGDIERQLEHFATGRYSAEYRHPIA